MTHQAGHAQCAPKILGEWSHGGAMEGTSHHKRALRFRRYLTKLLLQSPHVRLGYSARAPTANNQQYLPSKKKT